MIFSMKYGVASASQRSKIRLGQTFIMEGLTRKFCEGCESLENVKFDFFVTCVQEEEKTRERPYRLAV